ncbi:MAG: VCBS repeat-containing protein [Burkholderiales bacterium]|nr:VCBS repeat-containing protein [Burkholderiales bacterium]
MSYSVPVVVPPGRGGVEPKLSLQYSGGGVSGPFGHGWSMSGLSVVTRCGAVLDTDGVRRGVKYTADDRLCLDGQRLILTDASGVPVTSQTGYGGAGTEYRLEKDNHTRVRAVGGTSATGAQSFKVWTKAGLIYEYGLDANARIEAQGKTAVMAWAVSKISDTVGNFMTVGYGKWSNSFAGSVGSEWAVSQIRYTGNASQAATSRVDFTYEARPDKSEAYHEGSKSVNTQRLSAIRTYTGTATDGTGGVKVNTVKLLYTTGEQTGRSLLASVQSCGGAAETTCSPRTEFTYGAGPGFNFDQLSHASLTGVQLKNSAGTVGVIQGDFNGDGRQDIIRWSDTTSSNELLLSNGDGSFTLWTSFNLKNVQLGHSSGCYYSLVADFNLDGVSDLIRVKDQFNNPLSNLCSSGSSAQIYLGSTSGIFSTAIPVEAPILVKSSPVYRDVCIVDDEGGCLSSATILQRVGRNFQLSDVNGDGFPDLLISNTEDRNPIHASRWDGHPAIPSGCSERTCVFLGSSIVGSYTKLQTNISGENTYSSPSANVGYENIGAYKSDNSFVSDINGDGLPDIVVRSSSVRFLASGLPGQFQKLSTQVPTCSTGIEILDANGDGQWDLACLDYTSPQPYSLWINNGAGSFIYRGNIATWAGKNYPECSWGGEGTGCPPPPSDWPSYVQYVALDLDGDGRSEILSSRRKAEQGVLIAGNHSKIVRPLSDGSFAEVETNLSSVPLSWNGDYSFLVGDFAGVGSANLLRVSDNAASNALFRRATTQPPDLLASVKSPLGAVTTIHYKPLTDPAVYTRLTGAVYPTIDLVSTQWVVSSVDAPNGVGGVLTTEYAYGGQRAHINGRGYLGFRTLTRTTPAADGTSMSTRTTYRQDFPFITLPEETRRWPDAAGAAAWVSLTESTYGDLHTQGCPQTVATGTPRLYRPVVLTNAEQSRDLNLAPMAKVTTSNGSYNCWSDPLHVTVETTGQVQGQSRTYTKATTNQYLAANTAGDSWILGRLARAEVNSTVPDVMLAASSGGAPTTFNGLALTVSSANVVDSRNSPGILSADITPTAFGGTPGYAYTWARLTGNTFTMATGANGVLTVTGNLTWSQSVTETFRVTVTDQDNAMRTQDVSVSYSVGAPPPLSATVTAPTVSGTRNTPGEIDITTAGVSVTGGSGVYTYSWVRLNGTRTTITNATSATPIFSTTVALGQDFTEQVRVTVMDSLGATLTKEMNVRYHTPSPLAASFSSALYLHIYYPGTYNSDGPASAPVSLVGSNGNYILLSCPRDNEAEVSFTLSVSGGVSPYVFSWQGISNSWLVSANSQSAILRFSAESQSLFQVVITDSAGNSTTRTANLARGSNGAGCGLW